MNVVGLDHIYVTVSDFDRSEAFYDRVFAMLGFRKGDKVIAGERHAHYFNRVLQYSIRPAHRATPHDPYAPGVHHVCLQVETRADVDAAYRALVDLGVEATSPALYPEYNDDYYATFFADPDGIRLELLARSRHRRLLVECWDELRVFLNPLAERAARAQEPARIEIESAVSEDAARLLAALDAELLRRYPATSVHGLDPAALAEGNGAFVIARIAGQAVGCGALRRLEPGCGEVKRMFVTAAARRRGLAREILRALEQAARDLGLHTLRVETGARQPEAMRLYASEGYARIPAYGEYTGDPLSVCFEKRF